MSMFAIKFDDKMRAAKAKGTIYKKIDTVFEGTPEFDALFEAYKSINDPLYQFITEDDGRTHTFFRIYPPVTCGNDTDTDTDTDNNKGGHHG